MSKVEDQLLSLIEMMTEVDHFQGDSLLYDSLNKFLHLKLAHDELVVLSGDKSLQEKKHFRTLYNKNYFQNNYHVKEIEEKMYSFHENGKMWEQFKIENENYLFFQVSESQKQLITGILRLKGTISEKLVDSFSRLIASHKRSSEQLKQYKKMEELVYTDDVTGLFNQRKLNQDLETALKKHRQINENFSILFIDIDFFKSVNDNHGHMVGTKILFDLASLLSCTVRESDYIYRYGGDEFVLLIPNTGPDAAKVIGERILNSIKGHTFELARPGEKENSPYQLSVSIGVASFPENAKNREDILELADKMMYQAKKTGRGKVCFTHDIFNSTVQD